MGMDEIDTKQQEEIESLKRTDVKHTTWIMAAMIIVIVCLFITTMMTLEKASAYSCPHKECPHYTGRGHNFGE